MNIPKNFKVITNATTKDNILNIYKYNDIQHKTPKIINNTKSKKSIYNWSALKFPVFSYKQVTEELKITLNNIYLISEHINKLQNILDKLDKKINTAGLSMNIFINNSFDLPFIFDYIQHFVMIRNHKLEIHANIELDTALVQNELQLLHLEEDELLQLVPENINSYYITDKKLQIFNKLYNQYIEYIDYHNMLSIDHESACHTYEYLLESLQMNLPNIPTMNLTTKNRNETFNINKHDLLLINQNATIGFFYVKKQYSKTLMQFLTAKNKRKQA